LIKRRPGFPAHFPCPTRAFQQREQGNTNKKQAVASLQGADSAGRAQSRFFMNGDLMGWSARSDEPSPSAMRNPEGKHTPAGLPVRSIFNAILAAALFGTSLHAFASQPSVLRPMGDAELRAVSARGLYDRYFDQSSKYLVERQAVEVLGTLATMLNPFTSLLDAEFSLRNAFFNPTNPFVIIGEDGSGLIRLPTTIGEIALRQVRIRGTNGASFGEVTIRNINLGGTTIRVSRR